MTPLKWVIYVEKKCKIIFEFGAF